MKRSYFTVMYAFYLFWISVPSFAQSMEDVVYFKNGSVVHGLILEEVPAVSLKIKTPDGNIYVYNMDDVSKIAKFDLPPGNSYGITSNSSSQGDGFGDGKNPGLALLLSFLLPGLGCYYNGGGDTGVGVICDGLYAGGIILALTAGYATTTVPASYYFPSYSYVTTTAFLWVGLGVSFSGWVLGMIDAPIYASGHQKHRNSYGDLFELKSKDNEIGFNFVPMNHLGETSLSLSLAPSLTLRF